MVGVAGPASVPQRDVEISVRSKRHLPPVVVGGRLALEQDLALGGAGGVHRGRREELHDVRVPAPVGVVHVESPVRLELGMERESQEPLLAPAADPGGDVEKDARHEGIAREHPDRSRLLDDEEPVRVTRSGL